MMSNKKVWQFYKPFFEKQGYKCVTPTLRYHATKNKDNPDARLGNTGLLDYAGDLEKEIKKLDKPPIIIGHSMGGLLAQILASRGLASAAVFLNPAPSYGIASFRFSLFKGFARVLLVNKFWSKPFRVSFKKAKYLFLNNIPQKYQKKVYEELVYESGRALAQIGFWYLDKSKSSKVEYAKVKCPTLFIGAKKDRNVPVSLVKKAFKQYKNAEYKEFAQFGHLTPLEPGWETIAEYILGWIGELEV